MQKPLVILSSMATRQILTDLAADYRQRFGVAVTLRAMGGVEAAKLVRQAEPADLILLAAGAMAGLEREGHVEAGSVRPFARSAIAVAVKAGSKRPELSNGDTVRAAMLAARSVGYSTGPSGDYLKSLWDKWGIAASVAPRSKMAPPSVPVAALIASGEVDLGFQQLSELTGHPGVEVVGALPADIQQITTFSVGISKTTSDRAAAERIVAFLISDAATAAKTRHGMTA